MNKKHFSDFHDQSSYGEFSQNTTENDSESDEPYFPLEESKPPHY